jgi:uncharacterized membrane protein
MRKSRILGYFLCFVLICVAFGGMVGDQVALAESESSPGDLVMPPNQEQPQIQESLDLSSQFPVLEASAGNEYSFEVEFIALLTEDRTFDLTVDKPRNWVSIMQPRYEDTNISAIRIRAFQTTPEKIKVIVAPLPWDLPDPGEYPITVTATSGDLSASIELKAIVTARYEMDVYTETGRLNTKATTGKENHVAIKVRNSGSADIEKVTLSSVKPEGWTITFNPEKVESLEPGLAQDIDVVIEPAEKAIAGDYMVTLRAESEEVNESLELRVTVMTPTIWGWVGIGIVLLVIAGLGILFRQLGRR